MGKQAFDARREQHWFLEPEGLVIVGIDTDDGPEHPLVNNRVTQLKKDGVKEELVQSVLLYGIIQPVTVRKDGSDVQVVMGRHRVLAAREANKRLIDAGSDPILVPCLYRKNNDGDSITGVIEVENAHRVDSSPLTKARDMVRAIERGKDPKRVAIEFGVSVEVLKNQIKLLELSPEMQQAVEAGHITPTAAVTYSDLPHAEQARVLDEAAKLGVVISVPEARRQRAARSEARAKGESEAKGASPRGKPVSVAVLRKLLDHESFMDGLEPTERALLAWVCGEQGMARRIKGLTGALKEIGAIKDE